MCWEGGASVSSSKQLQLQREFEQKLLGGLEKGQGLMKTQDLQNEKHSEEEESERNKEALKYVSIFLIKM